MADKFIQVDIKKLAPDNFRISLDQQIKYDGNFDGIKTLILENVITSYQELRVEEKWKSLTSEPHFRDLIVERMGRNLLFVYCFFINREAQEGFYSEIGYSDIKIDIAASGRYFAFECKRLDDKTGKSSLQQKYIDDGLDRFIAEKYAKEEDFGGMIGFVVTGEIENIVLDMKGKVKNHCFVHSYGFLLNKFCDNCRTSFQSKHVRKNSLGDIHIYHLFLDFIG